MTSLCPPLTLGAPRHPQQQQLAPMGISQQGQQQMIMLQNGQLSMLPQGGAAPQLMYQQQGPAGGSYGGVMQGQGFMLGPQQGHMGGGGGGPMLQPLMPQPQGMAAACGPYGMAVRPAWRGGAVGRTSADLLCSSFHQGPGSYMAPMQMAPMQALLARGGGY